MPLPLVGGERHVDQVETARSRLRVASTAVRTDGRVLTESVFAKFVRDVRKLYDLILLQLDKQDMLSERAVRRSVEDAAERLSPEPTRANRDDGAKANDGFMGILDRVVDVLKKAYATLKGMVLFVGRIVKVIKTMTTTKLLGIIGKILARLGIIAFTSLVKLLRVLGGPIAKVAAVALTAAAGASLYKNLVGRTDSNTDDNKVTPDAGTDDDELSELGAVTQKYESGRGGVATISGGVDDPGGVSYGKYQLSSKRGTMAKFLSSDEGKQFAPHFRNAVPGTAAFNAAYAELADGSQAKAFDAAQRAFIIRTHYKPAAILAARMGFNVADPRVREAIFSASVQHRNIGRVLQIASDGGDVSHESPEQQVHRLYEARKQYVAGLSDLSPGMKLRLTTRYEKEKADVQGIPPTKIAGSSAPPAIPPTQTGTAGSGAPSAIPPTQTGMAGSDVAGAASTTTAQVSSSPASPALVTNAELPDDKVNEVTSSADYSEAFTTATFIQPIIVRDVVYVAAV